MFLHRPFIVGEGVTAAHDLDALIPSNLRVLFWSDSLSCQGAMVNGGSGIIQASYLGVSGSPTPHTGTAGVTRPYYSPNASDYNITQFYNDTATRNSARFRCPITWDSTFDPVNKGFTFIEFGVNLCDAGALYSPYADNWGQLTFQQEPAAGSAGMAIYTDPTKTPMRIGQTTSGPNHAVLVHTPTGLLARSVGDDYTAAWLADNPGGFIAYGPKFMMFAMINLGGVTTSYYANEVNQTLRTVSSFNNSIGATSVVAAGTYYAHWALNDDNSVAEVPMFNPIGKGVYLLAEGAMTALQLSAFTAALFNGLRMNGAS